MENVESKQKSIGTNYIYNLIFQIVSIIAPLITTPYLARVLQNNGIGQVSFTMSIVTYFTIAASLGFSIYGQREIARCKNNKTEQSKIFFEILALKLISVSLCVGVYILTIVLGLYDASYKVLLWILVINIVSVFFDVTYFFQGKEEFKFIAVRNTIIKVLSVVLIFVFVKKHNDTWVYILISSLGLLISNLSLWLRLRKSLVRVSYKQLKIKRHLLPSLRLFIPTLAISVYAIVDKTLIGIMVPGTVTTIQNGVEIAKKISDVENGYYHQAEQLVKMALTLITALGTVIIPRNSQLVAEGKEQEFKNNISRVLRFTFFLGLPIVCGIISISFSFSGWFYGDGYEKVPFLLIILSPLVLIIGLSNIFGLQCLLPLKKDTHYTLAIVAGAVLNLVLNLILIPFLYSYGAAISTVVAELVVAVMMLIFIKKENLLQKQGLQDVWKYVLASAVMLIVLGAVQIYLVSSILNTLFLIILGISLYLIVLHLLNDSLIRELEVQARKRIGGIK